MLIECPECKEKVSDTAEVCIHCGAPIVKAKKERVKFNDLPVSEQEKLRNEFYEKYPKHKTLPAKIKKTSEFIFLIWMAPIALFLVIGIILKFESTPSYVTAFISVGAFLVLTVLLIVMSNKTNRVNTVSEKRFYTWLEEKGYTVYAVLDEKSKRIYDSITDIAAEEKKYGLD